MKIINKKMVQETTKIGNSNRTVSLPLKSISEQKSIKKLIKSPKSKYANSTRPCLGCRRQKRSAN